MPTCPCIPTPADWAHVTQCHAAPASVPSRVLLPLPKPGFLLPPPTTSLFYEDRAMPALCRKNEGLRPQAHPKNKAPRARDTPQGAQGQMAAQGPRHSARSAPHQQPAAHAHRSGITLSGSRASAVAVVTEQDRGSNRDRETPGSGSRTAPSPHVAAPWLSEVRAPVRPGHGGLAPEEAQRRARPRRRPAGHGGESAVD